MKRIFSFVFIHRLSIAMNESEYRLSVVVFCVPLSDAMPARWRNELRKGNVCALVLALDIMRCCAKHRNAVDWCGRSLKELHGTFDISIWAHISTLCARHSSSVSIFDRQIQADPCCSCIGSKSCSTLLPFTLEGKKGSESVVESRLDFFIPHLNFIWWFTW